MKTIDELKFLSITMMWIPSAESYLCIIIDEYEDTFRGYAGRPSSALEKAIEKLEMSDPNTGPITLTMFQETGETSLEHLRAKELKLLPPPSFGEDVEEPETKSFRIGRPPYGLPLPERRDDSGGDDA